MRGELGDPHLNVYLLCGGDILLSLCSGFLAECDLLDMELRLGECLSTLITRRRALQSRSPRARFTFGLSGLAAAASPAALNAGVGAGVRVGDCKGASTTVTIRHRPHWTSQLARAYCAGAER